MCVATRGDLSLSSLFAFLKLACDLFIFFFRKKNYFPSTLSNSNKKLVSSRKCERCAMRKWTANWFDSFSARKRKKKLNIYLCAFHISRCRRRWLNLKFYTNSNIISVSASVWPRKKLNLCKRISCWATDNWSSHWICFFPLHAFHSQNDLYFQFISPSAHCQYGCAAAGPRMVGVTFSDARKEMAIAERIYLMILLAIHPMYDQMGQRCASSFRTNSGPTNPLREYLHQ